MSIFLPTRRPLWGPGWTRNPLWNAARSVPSLDLRFADNKSLVDATTGQNLVTFTRASSGTYVDSQGVIRTATTNLALRSEKLDETVQWNVTGSGATITSTTDIAAPNGTMTAWTLTSSGAAAQIQQAIGGTSGATYTGSFWIRRRSGAGTVNIRVAENTNTALTGVTSDWQRFSFTATSTSTTIRLGINLSGTDDAVDLWGAQLEQSTTVGEYIPTTSTINSAPRFDHNPTTGESLGLLVEESRTNVVLQSEAFGTAWTTVSASVSANTTTAPDGTLTADTITASSSTTGRVQQTITFTGDGDKAISVWLKAGTAPASVLKIDDSTAGFVNRLSITVTWTAGVASAVASNGTLQGIDAFPNGWYRIRGLAVGVVAANTNRYRIEADTTNGTGTVIAWGAQAENGAFSTSYIPTTTAAVTRSADVASISGSNFGVSRTNLVLQSEDFGTTWLTNNYVITANTIASPSGTTTADKLARDTTNVMVQVTQNVTCVANTAYTLSCFVKAAEWSKVGLREGSATGNYVTFDLSTATVVSTSGATGTITPFPNGWYRVTMQMTTGAAQTTYGCRIIPLPDTYTSGNPLFSFAGDGTSGIYLWGAQLETSSTATAYIPTTTAAVTVFESSWYRQDEGTVFYDGTVSQGLAGFPWFYNISNGTVNNSIGTYQFTNGIYGSVVTGGVAAIPDPTVLFSPVSGSTAKHAFAVKTSDTRAAYNGSLSSAQTSTVMPTVNTLSIGTRVTANRMTGTIRRLTYWPQRLSNTTLQQITQ